MRYVVGDLNAYAVELSARDDGIFRLPAQSLYCPSIGSNLYGLEGAKSLSPAKKADDMGHSLSDIITALPPEEQTVIDANCQDMKQTVKGLRELRQIAGKAQTEIASTLNIKQPSVSQIEQQTDMYLSTLRSYVEAVGGELQLMVKLPQRAALRIHQLGDAGVSPHAAARSNAQIGGRRGR